jgi:HPt (histidine-containing phosphotransfer) domain-containing protein
MDEQTRRSGILAGQIAALGPAFRQRLVRDRGRVAALLGELEAAGDVPAPAAVREVESTAHKLHGTAAMFGYVELGEAAGRLEHAAHAAIADGLGGRAAKAFLAPLAGALTERIDAAVAGTPEGGAQA